MGCDIHIYTEIKKNNIWEAIKVKNSWKTYLKERLEKSTSDDNEKDIAYFSERFDEEPDEVYEGIYDGRNYDLFGILADVRNGRGFAGCNTGDGFIPISEPKGLPDDLSETIRNEADEWGCDGHSRTYFSLKELLDYDWNQFTTKRGWVGENEFKLFLEKGRPDGWSGDVGGSCVAHITNNEMKDIVNGITRKEEDKSYYTQIEWKTFYYESASCFYTDTIPQLKKIAEDNGITEDDVRIVFWFDN